MKAMDCDGDERVSLAEFRKWWESKGGMEYGADPAMWSAGAAEEWLESDAAAVEAAVRIESMQRGKMARRELAEQRAAATKIQAVQRGKASRRRAAQAVTTVQAAGVLWSAVAQYNSHAADDSASPDDLHFEQDDVIDVLQEDPEGLEGWGPDWAVGQVGDRTGLFPLNYVRRLDSSAADTPPSPVPSPAAAESPVEEQDAAKAAAAAKQFVASAVEHVVTAEAAAEAAREAAAEELAEMKQRLAEEEEARIAAQEKAAAAAAETARVAADAQAQRKQFADQAAMMSQKHQAEMAEERELTAEELAGGDAVRSSPSPYPSLVPFEASS